MFRNLKLLSFGDEADNEDAINDENSTKGMVSSHDILNDSKFSAQTADDNLEHECADLPDDVIADSDNDNDSDDENQLENIKLKLMQQNLEKMQKDTSVRMVSENAEKNR